MPGATVRTPRYDALPDLAFGRIAVANHLASRVEVEEALELEATIRERLGLSLPIGRILYERGLLRPAEVEAILAAQARAGRRREPAGAFGLLKLTPIEREVLAERLLGRGVVAPADLEAAALRSEELSALGLWLDPVEVLWLGGRIPPDAVDDALADVAAFRARHEGQPVEVRLPLPSAESAAPGWAEGLTARERLFGTLARLSGAVDEAELRWACDARHRLRAGREHTIGLEALLFARLARDPDRMRLLIEAHARAGEILGLPRGRPPERLSSLEREAVRRRLATGDEPIRDPRALERIEAYASVGLDVGPEDALLEVRGPDDPLFADLLAARTERDRRLLGGWNRDRAAGNVSGRQRFEDAFRAEATEPRWNPSSIGALALARGLVDAEGLAHALYVQLRAREFGVDVPIGEVLVGLGRLRPASLRALLDEQKERLARSGPHVALSGEDRLLADRLVAAGVLDAARIEENAAIRDRLRSLGLDRVGLAEVLARRGEVDEEVLRGLAATAAGPDERTRAIEESARLRGACEEATGRAAQLGTLAPERFARPARRSGPALAAAALLLAVAVAIGVLAERERRAREAARAPAAARTESALVEEPPCDPGAFQRAMGRAGWTCADGQWRHASEAPGATPPPDSPDAIREAFAARMRAEGYRMVEGNWFRPDAFDRLVEDDRRAGEGLVRARGRWLAPADLARPDAPPAEEPLEAPAIEALEAILVVGPDATHIGLRFDSRLPPGALLVFTLGEASRPGRAVHSASVRLPSAGHQQLEVAPLARPLPAGRYRLALDWLPSFQREGLLGPPRPATWTIELEVAAGPTARDDTRELLAVLDRLDRAATTGSPEDAIEAFERIGRLAEAPGAARRAEAVDEVAGLARQVCEILCTPGGPADERNRRLEDARAGIARARRALEPER